MSYEFIVEREGVTDKEGDVPSKFDLTGRLHERKKEQNDRPSRRVN
jgi:hypothetical protein